MRGVVAKRADGGVSSRQPRAAISIATGATIASAFASW